MYKNCPFEAPNISIASSSASASCNVLVVLVAFSTAILFANGSPKNDFQTDFDSISSSFRSDSGCFAPLKNTKIYHIDFHQNISDQNVCGVLCAVLNITTDLSISTHCCLSLAVRALNFHVLSLHKMTNPNPSWSQNVNTLQDFKHFHFENLQKH